LISGYHHGMGLKCNLVRTLKLGDQSANLSQDFIVALSHRFIKFGDLRQWNVQQSLYHILIKKGESSRTVNKSTHLIVKD
jgi:hypothetical protein